MPHSELEQHPITYLMPIYSLGSWIYLVKEFSTGKWMMGVAGFGFAWACINTIRMRETGRMDKGIFTFGLVMALHKLHESGTVSFRIMRYPLAISCFLVAANYAGAIGLKIPQKMVKHKLKSPFWAKIFTYYCYSSVLFWVAGAAGTCWKKV